MEMLKTFSYSSTDINSTLQVEDMVKSISVYRPDLENLALSGNIFQASSLNETGMLITKSSIEFLSRMTNLRKLCISFLFNNGHNLERLCKLNHLEYLGVHFVDGDTELDLSLFEYAITQGDFAQLKQMAISGSFYNISGIKYTEYQEYLSIIAQRRISFFIHNSQNPLRIYMDSQ